MEGDPRGYNCWYLASNLDLGGAWAEQWTSFVKGLSHGGIRIGNHDDSLLWLFNKNSGMVSAKKSYELIVSEHLPLQNDGLLTMVWGFNIPLKLKCFT